MPRTTAMSKLKKAVTKSTKPKAKVPVSVMFPSTSVPSSVVSSAFDDALASYSENNLKRRLDDDDDLTDDDVPVATMKRVADLEKEVEMLKAQNASLVTANDTHVAEFERIERNRKERQDNIQGLSNRVTKIREDLDYTTACVTVMERANPVATGMAVTALERRVTALESKPAPIVAEPAKPCELKDEVARLRVMVDALCRLSSSQYKAHVDSIKMFKDIVWPVPKPVVPAITKP